MGVFSHLIAPIRLASVRAKVNEFGPVGLLAQYLFEGEIEAASLARFGLPQPTPDPVEPPPPPDPGNVIPEPPPPSPPDLPTRCPDEEEEDGDEDGDEDGEGPRVEIPLREIVIDAPEFWRGIDWSIDDFPAPRDEEVEGIPFDRVDLLLEYDARFGSVPTEQRWQPNLPSAVPLFTLDGEGALRFQLTGTPAFFTAEAPLRDERLVQVHCYFNILPERISNALEQDFSGFAQRLEANDRRELFRGMRADWVRVGRGEFHYVTLDAQTWC